jgi:hypothetical protein
MGSKITHFGDPGSGQAAKASHNMICGITAMAVMEGFALADAMGLDLGKFYTLCAGAAAQSWTLENRCPIPGVVAEAPASNNFDPGFAVRLMAKDLRLAPSCRCIQRTTHALWGRSGQSLYRVRGNQRRPRFFGLLHHTPGAARADTGLSYGAFGLHPSDERSCRMFHRRRMALACER